MMRRGLVRIILALIVGAGIAVTAPHVLAADTGGQGCAVGHRSRPVGEHSRPVGEHSKPCPTPPGCAIGDGGPIGNHSKPCPSPPGCAIGNPRFVGDASKPCPTPPGHHAPLAGLAGSFTGSQHVTFAGNGCTFAHQVFDATYPSVSEGVVTLHIAGCVNPAMTQYSGTFTIATNTGTLGGAAFGAVSVSSLPNTFALTATTTSSTGSFKKRSGTLQIHIDWNGGPAISGSVNAA